MYNRLCELNHVTCLFIFMPYPILAIFDHDSTQISLLYYLGTVLNCCEEMITNCFLHELNPPLAAIKD